MNENAGHKNGSNIDKPALVAARQCGPMPVVQKGDVEKHSRLLRELVICVNKKAKGAEDTPVSRPSLATVEVHRLRNRILCAHIWILEDHHDVQLHKCQLTPQFEQFPSSASTKNSQNSPELSSTILGKFHPAVMFKFQTTCDQKVELGC